jgi:hypothetical protein
MFVYLAISIVLAVVGVLSLLSGGIVSGVLGLVAAAIGLWSWAKLDAQLVGVQLVNLASQEITRGRLDEAEHLMSLVPRRGSIGSVPRGVALIRTMIAMERGAPEDAVREATRGAGPKLGILLRAYKRSQRAKALSLRAFARVALGQTAEAEKDAAEAEAMEEALPDAIARARLVRVLIASRADRHDEVATILRNDGELLGEHLAPNERSLLRAVARMTQRRKRSVYREPAKPIETDVEPNKLAGWIARIAPDAAAFADETRPIAERIDEPVAPPPAAAALAHQIARTRAAAATKVKKPRPALVAALWVVLIVLFLTIWQFLSTPVHVGAPVEIEPTVGPSEIVTLFPVIFFVLFAAIVTRQIFSTKGAVKRSFLAARAAALGDRDAARAEYTRLAEHRLPGPSAAASLELAKLSYADVDLEAAITACERGLARLDAQPLVRANYSDVLVPSLVAELAVAKAATGRIAEADAELATLMREHAQFGLLASAHARVRLVRAARMGEIEAVAAVARERTAALPLPRREELLADLALAATTTVSEDERERLASELGDARLSKWIEAIAPGLRDRALGKAQRARIAEAQPEEEIAEEVAEPQLRRAFPTG